MNKIKKMPRLSSRPLQMLRMQLMAVVAALSSSLSPFLPSPLEEVSSTGSSAKERKMRQKVETESPSTSESTTTNEKKPR